MLQEAEYDVTAQAMGHGNPRDVSGLYARFYSHPMQDEKASEKEGRPIFRDVDYVEIRVPGNNTSVISRPVRDRDLQEFPKQWAAYKNQQAQPVEGTPLEEWPLVTRSQVEELKYFGVQTVEQLAQMSDNNAQNFMGLNVLRQKARDFMDAAKSNAPLDQIRNENQMLRDELAVLKDQIEKMGANQVPEKSEAAPTRRRRRSTEG